MKCPIDTETDLVMADRQGIEIDYCPKCRGVWLDRGELDKIIDRNEQEVSGYDRGHERERDPRPSQGSHGKKRKSSLLSELFEMGG